MTPNKPKQSEQSDTAPAVYYAEYTSGVAVCRNQFVSSASSKASFPPYVEYDCSMCSNKHGFKFRRYFMVATPRQLKAFQTYCKNNELDTDVEVPTKPLKKKSK